MTRHCPTVLLALTGVLLIAAAAARADRNGDLFTAISNLNVVQTKACLAKGADPLARDPSGNTTLITACLSGEKMELVQLLLDKGVPVNASNTNGYTALILASERGNPEIVKLLLQMKADVNAQSNSGMSALMMAAMRNRLEALRLLLDGGADVHLASKEGFPAISYAAENSHISAVKLLLQHGADPKSRSHDGTLLVRAAANGYAALVKLLLDSGSDVNEQDVLGNTALFKVAETGKLAGLKKTELAKQLIEKGAKADAPTITGMTPLMAAAGAGSPEVVKLLLASGADPNARTKTNQTALYYAAARGNIETVKALLAKGADVNVKTTGSFSGETALKNAIAARHQTVVQLLKNAGAKE